MGLEFPIVKLVSKIDLNRNTICFSRYISYLFAESVGKRDELLQKSALQNTMMIRTSIVSL